MTPVLFASCCFIGWLILLRVTYINGLISDWNYNLSTLINHCRVNKLHSHILLEYYEGKTIKPYKYYHKLNTWTMNKIIRDPFLIDEVQKIINKRYSKY